MMDVFKVGDVVCLKSSGPKMTIIHIDSKNATCTWFHTVFNNTVEKAIFPVEALKLYVET